MPTHMPVLVDFWCIGDNPGMKPEEAWNMLATMYNADTAAPIVIVRPGNTLTYTYDPVGGRITLAIVSSSV